MSYLGNYPATVARTDYTFIASTSQTVFSGVDSNGLTLAYDVSNFDVFANGVLLNKNDYTNITGSAITLNIARNLNDVITLRAYGVISTIDTTNFGLLSGMSTVFPYGVQSRRYANVGFESYLFNASDSSYPTFGPSAIHGRTTAKYNGVLGEVVQDGSNGNSFPCGVIGYGVSTSPGNQVFGGFFRVDANTSGVATHEFNTFNYSGQDAPTSYPWSRAFGISNTVPVALTVAAGGNNVSAAGIEIGSEGSVPNAFQYGIALQKGGIKQWSYYQDADATTGPNSGMYMAIPGSGINLILKTTGTQVAKNAVLAIENASATSTFSVRQDGSTTIGSSAQALAALNVGGSATLFGLTNTAALIGVDVAGGDSLGACVQIGSTNGNSPFIAASMYGTSNATASPLVFYTNTTEVLRFLTAFNTGFAVKTPVPSTSYASDSAAATGGIAVGQWYRNGSNICIRVS